MRRQATIPFDLGVYELSSGKRLTLPDGTDSVMYRAGGNL